MVKSVKSKLVVITGASAGVGRATAREFGKAGAKVVVLARNEESLAGTKKEVEDEGGECYYYKLDVANQEQVEATVQKIETEIGPIDVWVNNAMASVFSPIKKMTTKEYQRVTEVTYLGQVYCTISVLKFMLKRNRGSIVLVGSALLTAEFRCSRHIAGQNMEYRDFLIPCVQNLLHDKSNVKVTMVEFPALNTTQFGWVLSRLPNKARPMGTVYQPEVAARAIVYACRSRPARNICGHANFPGHNRE